MAGMLQGISHYLCYLLRHNPERAALTMDRHGWVPVAQLIENVSRTSKYTLTMELLEQIVAEDGKGPLPLQRGPQPHQVLPGPLAALGGGGADVHRAAALPLPRHPPGGGGRHRRQRRH